jgi:hypothetical protein
MKLSFRHLLITISFIIIIALLYGWGCQFFPNLPGYHSLYYTPQHYEQELKSIELGRVGMRAQILMAKKDSSKSQQTLRRAGRRFQADLDGRLFPYWFGTSYDFYGTTQVPGQGEIACGYFVTTILEDMGVGLDRVALAKAASEKMIKALVDEKHIRRYSNQSLKRLLSDVRADGGGIYIVGLDTHTGFLVHDGKESYFIHASGRYPWQVVEERAEESIALSKSVYRVTGHLTGDLAFIKHWIEGIPH